METVETTEMETVQNRVVREHDILELKAFGEGMYAGLKYYVRQVKTGSDAIKLFGEDVVAALVNRALTTAQRTKAQAKIDYEDKQQKQLEIARRKSAGDDILVTETEAANYIPGEREITSPLALLKESARLKKLAFEAKAKGQPFEEFITKSRELTQLAMKLAEDQTNSAEERLLNS